MVGITVCHFKTVFNYLTLSISHTDAAHCLEESELCVCSSEKTQAHVQFCNVWPLKVKVGSWCHILDFSRMQKMQKRRQGETTINPIVASEGRNQGVKSFKFWPLQVVLKITSFLQLHNTLLNDFSVCMSTFWTFWAHCNKTATMTTRIKLVTVTVIRNFDTIASLILTNTLHTFNKFNASFRQGFKQTSWATALIFDGK